MKDPARNDAAAKKTTRAKLIKYGRILLSIAIALGIFVLIIPKIANYNYVLDALQKLSWGQLAIIVGATFFNLMTYWWQMQAGMPGLTLGQAAVNNQTGTTIANVVPGGGVISLGVVIEMFRSWGFSKTAIGLEISTTGIWNSFMKMGLPVFALALLGLTGGTTAALIVPALVGLAALIGAVLLFALALWRKHFARAIGNGLGKAWSWIRKLFKKPPVTDWGEAAVRFRKDTIRLVEKRWLALTITTVVSHLALFAVLLLSLRFVGVTSAQITWIEALAVFAFARLLSAAPITPGGVGVVELALIAGLYAAGRHAVGSSPVEFKAEITAAVLLFRALTYGVQIPLGGFTYIIWRRNKRWRKEPAHEPTPEPVPVP